MAIPSSDELFDTPEGVSPLEHTTTIRDFWLSAGENPRQHAKEVKFSSLVTEWAIAFIKKHPEGRNYQLYQVLVGGTPESSQLLDTDDGEIYATVKDINRQVTEFVPE